MADYAMALIPLVAIGALMWLVSVPLRDVGIVDPVWSLLFIAAGGTWWWYGGRPEDPRTLLALGMVATWAIRLAVYLAIRKWGEPEDRRYAKMRDEIGPIFWLRSLVTVFSSQAVLAWIVAAPIYAAIGTGTPLRLIDAFAVGLWGVGFFFQVVGDAQLARFKADPSSSGRVLDTGLWGLTRHPNYFGEFCMWWGVWLVAWVGGGDAAWWSVIGPLLISFLLMKVSGVTMLEVDIADRRAKYRDYILRTNAFFPGRRRPDRAD